MRGPAQKRLKATPPSFASLRRRALSACVLMLLAPPALADPPRDRHDPTPPARDDKESQSILSVAPEPLHTAGQERDALAKRGVTIGGKYIGDVFTNTSGGIKSGTAYEGKFRVFLDADFEKLAGLAGLTLHVSASQLQGRGPNGHYVGALMPVSNIESAPSTRLYELWAQQSFFDNRVSVRIGEIGADQEFIYPFWAQIFVNNTFGWPAIAINNLPSGGPAFPLSSLGVRVRARLTEQFLVRAAVFDGDPAGPQGSNDDADPTKRNRDGVRFRLKDPPFAIAEAQAKYKIGELDGVFKFGYWRHFGRFADLRLGTDFLSLADPNSNGAALQRRGDQGFYAIVDQQIGKADRDANGRGAGFFARASASPNDRNLVNFYADAGVAFVGVLPPRPEDMFGVSVGYARVSGGARGFDRDTAFFSNPLSPIRSSEMLLEATYIARLAPGWTIQPDLQYIRRPGGNLPDPRDPNGVKTVGNSVVLGLRTLIRF